jgi:hypothetical protein
MAKHTQAHMSRKVDQNQSAFFREQTKRQMEYYMGAKLIEIGVNPQSAIYRWSEETQGKNRTHKKPHGGHSHEWKPGI